MGKSKHPIDEPGADKHFDLTPQTVENDEHIPEQISKLIHDELFGVLCTQGDGQPYGSLIGFAANDQLSAIAFATPIATRKFKLLTDCDHVALVIDTRDQHPDDMTSVEAITVTGRAVRVEPGEEYDLWAKRLTARHPYLKSFVAAASSALFRIDVYRYFYVTRFQKVSQWIPPKK